MALFVKSTCDVCRRILRKKPAFHDKGEYKPFRTTNGLESNFSNRNGIPT
jgi:hypothetical protein